MIDSGRFAQEHRLDPSMFNAFCSNNDVGVSEYGRRTVDETKANEIIESFRAYLKEQNERASAFSATLERIIVTTGVSVEGYSISEYLGIVTGECALGTGFLSSLGASFADFFGTSSEMYSSKLKQAKEIAINSIKTDAANLGATAIIGMDLDYTTFAKDIMGVVCTGTAVKIKPQSGM